MKSYSDYLAEIFPGQKVQKISIDAGFTCPNRDGSISYGGCIYCRNDSFTPGYCKPSESITVQLQNGKKFFSRKYPEMKYLAYFQSYTGTYNKDINKLKNLYQEALSVEDVIGLIVATRPDCINDEVLNVLENLSEDYPVFVELGAETSHNETLKLINRNHTWEDVENAVLRIDQRNIHCGLHLIAGLPNETREMILRTVEKAVALPIETLKIHQLQVLKDTILLSEIEAGKIKIPQYSVDEYLDLCVEIIKRVPQNIVIERFLSQSPPEMVVYPQWRLKNYEFVSKLEKLIK